MANKRYNDLIFMQTPKIDREELAKKRKDFKGRRLRKKLKANIKRADTRFVDSDKTQSYQEMDYLLMSKV